MTDKAMDEVMREYIDKFFIADNECKYHNYTLRTVEQFIPKACRAYARKVVEGVHKICTTTGPDGQTAFRIADKVQGVINRLTDEQYMHEWLSGAIAKDKIRMLEGMKWKTPLYLHQHKTNRRLQEQISRLEAEIKETHEQANNK